MNFSPYHQFRDCNNLESTIRAIQQNGNISELSLHGFDIYHFSLLHKLRSAEQYLESLRDYLGRQDTVDEEPAEIAYTVNFHFDGFTFAIGSSLDIFAREILCYLGIQLPRRVYFHTARNEISKLRNNDPLEARLADPNWLGEFKDYRNTATHENIVGSSFTIDIDYHAGKVHRRLLFPLPDDPRESPSDRTYQNNKDIVKYCEDTFTRTLRLIHPVYSDLCTRIQQNGSLPV